MKKPFMLKSTSFIAMMLLSQFAMAKAVGTVTFAAGDVTIAHADKTVTKATKNAELNAGDAIETKEGRVQLSMIDGGKISLQPNTIYKINQFEFTGKEDGSEYNFTELVKGGLRTVSGLIGHKNRDHYQLKTAVATIGIRGTEFTVNFNDNNLLMTTNHGSVDVCNLGGCLNAITGQTIEVSGIGGAPKPSNKAAKAAAAPPAGGKAVFAAGESIVVAATTTIPKTMPAGNDTILLVGLNQSINSIGAATFTGNDSATGKLLSFADNANANIITTGNVIDDIHTADGLVNLGSGSDVAINGQTPSMASWVTGIATPLSTIASLNGSNYKGTYIVDKSSAPYLVSGGTVIATGAANLVIGVLIFDFEKYKLTYDLTVPINGTNIPIKGDNATFASNGKFTDFTNKGALANGAVIDGLLIGSNAQHAALVYGINVSGSGIPGSGGNLYGSLAATR